jgi:asparagine synthase (glutamine-hydrolysing)
MCGIAGILTPRHDLDLAPVLERMVRAIRHRGPDDEGYEEIALPAGYRLGLANTRLAILDLSSAGHQPMTDRQSGSWIAHNGEVYNHMSLRPQLPGVSFDSTSDTETILKGWAQLGSRVLASLRGMYAFAMYDGRRRQFWLVRDRLGIKPLYVSQVAGDTWVFASEVRALLASGLIPGRLNAAALNAYLAFGAVSAPWTLLEGVQSLLPGEYWRFDLDRPDGRSHLERVQYWRPPFEGKSSPSLSHAEAVERLRPILVDAVGQRMVSDVPVGIFLSGGIDSSAVVAALASKGYDLHTFSVVFGERQYDESEFSRLIARQFNTEHTELHLSPAQVLSEYEQALTAYDQPSIDGINTYFISRITRQAGIKVALSGLGGDELFAGYSYFKLMARLERKWPRRMAWLIYQFLRRKSPQNVRAEKLGAILSNGTSRLDRYAICRQVMTDSRRSSILSANGNGKLDPTPEEVRKTLESAAAELDAVNAHSLFELSLYLANMLLRDTDQMSMAHALEVREPLLDHVLVETVVGLPGALKLEQGRQRSPKALLVDALPAELPRRLFRRPKMGFVFPWEQWLRHELKEQISSLLSDRAALEVTGLDRQSVHDLWTAFLAGKPSARYTDVLSLAHLLHWVGQHRLTAPAVSPEREPGVDPAQLLPISEN